MSGLIRGKPIKRQKDGRYQIKLSDHEREILRTLPLELVKQVEAGEDDGSMFRLFPPGYSEDLGRQVEYDRLMRDDLQTSHIETLQALGAMADADDVSDEEINTWIKALNQLRLVLGTRLDIQDEKAGEDIEPDDPRAGAFALYGYLGYLQDEAVHAMSESLE
jgi:hypothetical protein